MAQSIIEMQTLGYPVIAILSAALIVFAIDPGARSTRLSRFFQTRPMRVLGKYSYALYVFHFPLAGVLERAGLTVQTFPRVHDSELPGAIAFTIIGITLSLLIALASWNLYEKHFLKLKRFFPRREIHITNMTDDETAVDFTRTASLTPGTPAAEKIL